MTPADPTSDIHGRSWQPAPIVSRTIGPAAAWRRKALALVGIGHDEMTWSVVRAVLQPEHYSLTPEDAQDLRREGLVTPAGLLSIDGVAVEPTVRLPIA